MRTSRYATLAATLVWLGMARATPTTIEVHTVDAARSTGTAAFKADGGSCQLAWTGTGKPLGCAFELPDAASEITLTGSFGQRGRRPATGTARWRVVDIGPMMARLRDANRPFGERMRAFLDEKARFEQRHRDALGGATLAIEAGPSAREADVASAEQRLGYPLPPGHRSLLTIAGPFTNEDSFVVPATTIKSTLSSMTEDWETDRARLDRVLSAGTKTIYASSALLYTNVGDGYGGLAYRPSGEASCGAGPAFYWVHQDAIDRPQLLKSRDGACKDYDRAMLWVMAQDALVALDDVPVNVVIVDRSSPAPFLLEMTPEGDGFSFRLRPQWARID